MLFRGRSSRQKSPSDTHPWVAAAAGRSLVIDPEPDTEQQPRWRELVPHAAIPSPPPDRQLPLRELDDQEFDTPLFLLGAHSAAGEKTLARVLPEAKAADHAWPIAPQGRAAARVALVARTSASGLRAAQTALTDWMSGRPRAELAGVILNADAPGKLPAQLHELVELVTHAAGGRVTHIAWQPAWRLGDSTPDARVARQLSDLISRNKEDP